MIIDTSDFDIQSIFSFASIFLSAGGLALILNYQKERRAFHATNQAELIKELNKMIDDERRKCSADMSVLMGRINILEAQVASMQVINNGKTSQ